ncbi:hypothetical protein STRAU_0067 [Streptomyces aurantiacus JA 4570]|uniref:Uncharacterized protein n=1 Tax=Streptomyces aurantiacus JA 4570 TaxID=1286094 RepID=S3ZTY2_9ACTN|nr:hypothetical protein STRAU_0067 [Streptomyces aurantiacus JA 4570]
MGQRRLFRFRFSLPSADEFTDRGPLVAGDQEGVT